MKLKLGFSFCPNDTFIFYGLAEKKIHIENVEIEPLMADVEELNSLTVQKKLDVSKISVHTLAYITEDYILLSCGGAFGKKEAPVLVSKEKSKNEIKTVAIHGKNTTAFLLFKKFFSGSFEIVEMRYDKIIPSVLREEVDAGILIHEGRFTYKNYGLKLIFDFGEEWQKRFHLPIPLGCIVLKKELSHMKDKIEKAILESIVYACHNRDEVKKFVKKHAQELSDDVIEEHIKAFVNEYTLNMGEEGKKAIETLLETNI